MQPGSKNEFLHCHLHPKMMHLNYVCCLHGCQPRSLCLHVFLVLCCGKFLILWENICNIVFVNTSQNMLNVIFLMWLELLSFLLLLRLFTFSQVVVNCNFEIFHGTFLFSVDGTLFLSFKLWTLEQKKNIWYCLHTFTTITYFLDLSNF